MKKWSARPRAAVAIPPSYDLVPSNPAAIPCNPCCSATPRCHQITNADEMSKIPTTTPAVTIARSARNFFMRLRYFCRRSPTDQTYRGSCNQETRKPGSQEIRFQLVFLFSWRRDLLLSLQRHGFSDPDPNRCPDLRWARQCNQYNQPGIHSPWRRSDLSRVSSLGERHCARRNPGGRKRDRYLELQRRHIEFFAEVIGLLRKKGADDIKVFGGGGGTITHDDAVIMKRKGVDEVFFAGTSLEEMVRFVHQRYGKSRTKRPRPKSFDQQLAHKLSEIEDAYAKGKRPTRLRDATAWQALNAQRPTSKKKIRNSRGARIIGFTGPGGAGKTTLIDELVLRFLNRSPKGRIAILSHDPSVVGEGALLGDRATMINSQDDRVFMRSMAT